MSGASLSRPAVGPAVCFGVVASTGTDGGAGCSAAAFPVATPLIGNVPPSAQFGGCNDAAAAYSPGATLKAIRKNTVRIFGLLLPCKQGTGGAREWSKILQRYVRSNYSIALAPTGPNDCQRLRKQINTHQRPPFVPTGQRRFWSVSSRSSLSAP